jgi:hypothetical protein
MTSKKQISKIKQGVQLYPYENDQVKAIADKNDWSVMKTLNKIIVGQIPPVKPYENKASNAKN